MNDLLRKIEERRIQENAQRIVLAILVGAFFVGVITGLLISKII